MIDKAKIVNELLNNMDESDARERTNNIIAGHQFGAAMTVDELLDALTPTGGHAGITDRMERERSACIIHALIHAN
jgi:hypothetical protein